MHFPSLVKSNKYISTKHHHHYAISSENDLFRHPNIAISTEIPLSFFTPNTSTSTDGPGSGGSSPSPMGTPTQTCPGWHCLATLAALFTIYKQCKCGKNAHIRKRCISWRSLTSIHGTRSSNRKHRFGHTQTV